jgi:pimeloyl-ACP methyl ester carboxylesterase
VAGKEREYLTAFFDARIVNSAAVTAADIDVYVRAYASPGGMRSGFELYRAFDQDAIDNRRLMSRGRLPMPVLAVGGEASTSGPWIEPMMSEVAEDVTGLRIPGTTHWIPEENPTYFTDRLISFLKGSQVPGSEAGRRDHALSLRRHPRSAPPRSRSTPRDP